MSNQKDILALADRLEPQVEYDRELIADMLDVLITFGDKLAGFTYRSINDQIALLRAAADREAAGVYTAKAAPGDAEAVTAAEINALPDRIRRYIAAIETEADPAGTIRQNILVREENEMLRRLVAEGDAGAVAWQFRMHRTLPDGSRAGWQDCTKAHFDELNHPYQCDYDTRALYTRPAPPVVDEAMVDKAYRVCEDFIEEHGDGYINDLSDGQWNEMLRAALTAALGKVER